MDYEREFELKLATGKVVTWPGKNGINAAERYVDCEGGTVVAWREANLYGIFPCVNTNQIIG